MKLKPIDNNVGSLTAVEVATRRDPKIVVPAADGHANQVDEPYYRDIIARIPNYFEIAETLHDGEAEDSYKQSIYRLYNQNSSQQEHNSKFLPNASLSIAAVMSLAHRRGYRVQLIEPVFDNLYLYAQEKGVELSAIHENQLRDFGIDAIDFTKIDLLFLVSPNNPTGFTVSKALFSELAEQCAYHGVTLALDASFRAYDLTGSDHYQIVKDAGCSWIVIEDTGKTWPTQELKASILSCSSNLARDLNEIVEIDVLGWSKPVLLMLTDMAKHFDEVGLDKALYQRIARARKKLRKAISGTFLRTGLDATNSNLPVEWIEITDDRIDDLSLVNYFASFGLGLLPGRHFYFASEAPSNFVRFSLLKPEATIAKGAKLLRQGALQAHRAFNLEGL